MSDPTITPKQLTELEYEQLRGRLGALEVLMSQAWTAILKHVPDEEREDVIIDALIAQEDRWDRFKPISRTAAMDSAEGILTSALATVIRGESET